MHKQNEPLVVETIPEQRVATFHISANDVRDAA
jgi:hypothetical protein